MAAKSGKPELAGRLQARSLAAAGGGVGTAPRLPVSRPKARGAPRDGRLQPLGRAAAPAPAGDGTVKPLEAARKPALPPVGGRPAEAAAVDVAALGELPLSEVAELLRTHGDRIGFLYLGYKHDPRTSHRHHAYNLRVVPHSQINPSNYYTISQSGVTHFTGKASEFTPLDRFLQEIASFGHIKRKPFFFKFRLWKAFALWRKSVLSGKREAAGAVLQAELFAADPILGAAALQVRNLCLDVVQMRLCVLPAAGTQRHEEFLAAQRDQVAKVTSQLDHFRAGILDVVQRACRDALARASFELETPDADAGSAGLTYTEQSRRRAFFARMARFIRFVDLLVAGAMQSLAVESVAYLHDRLADLSAAALLEPAADAAAAADDAEQPPTPQPEDPASATPSKQARHTVPAFIDADNVRMRVVVPVEKKPSKAAFTSSAASGPADGEPNTVPLFRVSLDVSTESMVCSPDLPTLGSALHSVTELFEQSVVGVALLLTDPSLSAYTQPSINGRVEAVDTGEGVNLQQVLLDDPVLRSLRTNIHHLLVGEGTRRGWVGGSKNKERKEDVLLLF